MTLFTVLAEVKQESEQFKQHCKNQEQHLSEVEAEFQGLKERNAELQRAGQQLQADKGGLERQVQTGLDERQAVQ